MKETEAKTSLLYLLSSKDQFKKSQKRSAHLNKEGTHTHTENSDNYAFIAQMLMGVTGPEHNSGSSALSALNENA